MGCCGGSYLTGGETRRDHVVVVVFVVGLKFYLSAE